MWKLPSLAREALGLPALDLETSAAFSAIPVVEAEARAAETSAPGEARYDVAEAAAEATH